MLDNNTNKVVWVGVAIGVVSLLGLSAIVLFPQISGTMKPMIRHTAVMFADKDTNLVRLKNNSLLSSVAILSDSGITAKVSQGSTRNSVMMTLQPDDGTHQQGVWYGPGGSSANESTSDWWPGDKWQADIDVKVSDPSAVSWSYFGIASSTNVVSSDKSLSHEWKHYTVTGTRASVWGSLNIYFRNTHDKPVVVEIKNVSLLRKG